MALEALEKELVYVKVDSANAQQIEHASLQERDGLVDKFDPQELPSVLRFIAANGDIWLQYVVENGRKTPTGVIEFIPLKKSLRFDPNKINEDLSVSPFAIVLKEQERIFQDVRRFAKDKKITYHHGIFMSRRGGGYGTQLLKYAIGQASRDIIVCYIDGAQISEESGELQLVPNEDSFTLHLKAGFVLAGVVDPPVYDNELVYYSFVRIKNIAFHDHSKVALNLAEAESAKEVIDSVRYLTSVGYFGVEYNKKTHQMVFKKARL